MKRLLTRISVYVLSAIMLNAAISSAAIRIVAALPDLGSIASYIGGNKVELSAIAKANSNPHSVEVFPSYMAKVSRAAIYLKSGLGLDQWSDAIIDGSRNGKILTVDCSNGVSVLEKPVKVDASMGDVHPYGNPHYWLDPKNGIIVAGNITEALKKADPSNSAFYDGNFLKFKAESERMLAVWTEKMKPFDNRKIISYHSSWAYFAEAFHLHIVEHIEPLPGIPPTGKHLSDLVGLIKNDDVAFILQEPYFPNDAPNFLSRQTGVKVCKVAPSCADVGANSYFAHFDELVNKLSSAGGR